MADLAALSALDLRDRLAVGTLSAVDVAEAHIARIEAVEPQIGAWAWFDADFVRKQAVALDKLRKSGQPIGALHGVPVGLKDVIDTMRIPTENGVASDAGRVPRSDALLVERLKAAGALILGKTVTTELAFMEPGKTRNPHNVGRTPGGSSSGSAAAVAAGMTPLAIGTQTGGSVVRPASFCGVTGFKPTFAAIPTHGVLQQSPSLDTVGVFPRDPRDAALLCDVLFGPAEGDTPLPPPAMLTTVTKGAPLKPIFAVLTPPGADRAHPDTLAAIGELSEALGEQCFPVELPAIFAEAETVRRRINFAEMARCYHAYAERGGLAQVTQDAIAEGNTTLARDYIAALDWPKVLNAVLDEIFARCDAILCPAALGPAPGPETTGDAIFNGLWTLCGTPAVTVPVLHVEDMPLGVQLIGARGNDARLLRTAQWLYDWIETEDDA
ncbi:Glutamyl-tRNA(Gln) amidotransferase subunit A [Rhodobacteraceae bacterium THAF1]|uniref:amidase n=1 Tax=Palleronia sp. THAF1 TaxID=2587842 RepID=UPI000F41466C|nr:amidase [Palleronia sp. THAF1]QFU09985.1 Glutamyl-tRNA(Gln) amidotransferase subunit A [Palleronia sp. THAF1]VDC17110.1 Glutamyl-tRNA(Gln) amidotransferase subunit A [Rhodobacteraceae bacterium THAF1]